jgi:hypothetical protein
VVEQKGLQGRQASRSLQKVQHWQEMVYNRKTTRFRIFFIQHSMLDAIKKDPNVKLQACNSLQSISSLHTNGKSAQNTATSAATPVRRSPSRNPCPVFVFGFPA